MAIAEHMLRPVAVPSIRVHMPGPTDFLGTDARPNHKTAITAHNGKIASNHAQLAQFCVTSFPFTGGLPVGQSMQDAAPVVLLMKRRVNRNLFFTDHTASGCTVPPRARFGQYSACRIETFRFELSSSQPKNRDLGKFSRSILEIGHPEFALSLSQTRYRALLPS